MSDDATLSEAGEASTILPGDGPPHLVLVFECERPIGGSSRHALEGLDEVAIGRGAERTIARRGPRLALTVPDPRMSVAHSVLRRTGRGWSVEDAGSKNGTLLNEARIESSTLADGDLIECGRTFFLYREGIPPAHDGRVDVAVVPADGAARLSTMLTALGEQLRRLADVARAVIPVLVRGETGTGKEVAARAIHEASGRKGPFVAVNCGALPSTLVEAELFGARRGAYSGAIEDRPGLIRSADGGTLLLDEIGDLPAASQAALLRALQEREVVPVGGAKPVSVDFRLVAATHRDLRALVAEGRFRTDLHARLAGFEITLPPLRERREDLGLFLGTLLHRVAGARAAEVRVSPEAARLLFAYEWPQNVRELERCIETAVVLASQGVIRPSHLPDAVRRLEAAARPTAPADLSDEDARLRARLVELLEEHAGNVSAVARACGRQRVQIHRWIRRLGIDLDATRRGR